MEAYEKSVVKGLLYTLLFILYLLQGYLDWSRRLLNYQDVQNTYWRIQVSAI